MQILLLAAVISFALAYVDDDTEGEESGLRAFVEPLVIVLILVLNATVGVWQESNAESALEALKEMSAETAKVFRDGTLLSELPARELVPGDVVEIHTGDKVPADIRVVQLRTAVVRVEQAALTGESVAVAKTARACEAGEDCELQAKDNMLFASTGIASGTCLGVVNSIGMGTEIGKIQTQIQEAAEEEGDTPLKKKLDEFGEALAKVMALLLLGAWKGPRGTKHGGVLASAALGWQAMGQCRRCDCAVGMACTSQSHLTQPRWLNLRPTTSTSTTC